MLSYAFVDAFTQAPRATALARLTSAIAEADGVIVASALMRRLLDGAGPEEIGAAVGAMRSALDAG